MSVLVRREPDSEINAFEDGEFFLYFMFGIYAAYISMLALALFLTLFIGYFREEVYPKLKNIKTK